MTKSLNNEALTRLIIGAMTTQGFILKKLCNEIDNSEKGRVLGRRRLELMDLGDAANPNPHISHLAPRLMLEGMGGERTNDELLEMVQAAAKR